MYRTKIRGSQYGQTTDVIMGWVSAAATNPADAGTIATRVGNFWNEHLGPALVDDYTFTDVECVGMDDPTVGFTYSVAGGGTDGGDPAPAFVVANVRITTGLRGRSYMGRFGIPGIPLSKLDPLNGNALLAAARDDYGSRIDDFVTAVHTGVPAVE